MKMERRRVVFTIAIVLLALIGFLLISAAAPYFRHEDTEKAETAAVIDEPEKPIKPPAAAPAKPAVPEILPEIVRLRQQFSNDDIVGYVEIEGSKISYPVAHYSDNEYYLNRDLEGNETIYGSVFLDYENSLDDVDKLDDNTILYGHNMRDGSMFHDLRYFFDEEYYKTHPSITLITPYEVTKWEIFAFYQTTTDFYYIQTSFARRNEFSDLLSQMKTRARYDTGVEVEDTDKILTLSTCANEGGENRYVLNARLIRD